MSKKKNKNKFKNDENMRDMRKETNVEEDDEMVSRGRDSGIDQNVGGMKAGNSDMDMDGPGLIDPTERSNRTQDEGKVYDL